MTETTGVFVADMETHEVLFMDQGMKSLCPEMNVGAKCYRCFGREADCSSCPLERLRSEPIVIGSRRDEKLGVDLDIIAARLYLSEERNLAMICYGRVSLLEKRRWLEDKRYQIILRQTRTIVFETDPQTGETFISPFASEYLEGNFTGKSLAQVLCEDGVLHPDDIADFQSFRGRMLENSGSGEIVLRLKCRDGLFRWHKISMSSTRDPVDGRRLIMGTLTNVDEETRLRESLRHRAEYSTTVGIYNKDTFYRETERILRAKPCSAHQILRFDVNRFKSVNELFSAAEGDRVLRYIAQVIGALARKDETYGYFGNDIFSMCVSRSDEEVVSLVGQINDKVNEYPVDFNFILSTGIFRVERYDGQPVSFLCDRAALAQKTIKGNYIQRYAFYEQNMGDMLSREHYIIGSMRRALEEKQFVIYLQPKYDMRLNRAFGAEALVRWNHPDGKMIFPGDFIPLFERNGFIIRLDEYIWDLTCRTLRSWIDRGIDPVPISVNVSRMHLYDPALCEKIVALVEKYDLNPGLLELEITESAYTENEQSLYSIMERLQGMGFTFSMDDFGSGYSSLNMLKDIPVDMLKIDLNFLKESRRGKSVGKTILEATIHMAQRLSLPVIAEGVETLEQASVLLQAGCTRAQGYYYAKPMPVECFEQLLLHERGLCQPALCD